MKRYLIPLLLLLLTSTAFAVDFVTATISVTNTTGTTNGQTITVNGNTRTWTNSVSVPTTQILTNNTSTGAATNLYLHVANTPFTSLALGRTTSTNITLATQPGGTITVTLSDGWGSVSYSTNTLTSARAVRVPLTVESAGPRAEIASQLVTGINNYSSNSFFENSISVSNLVGRTNTQSISGTKTFSDTNGIWYGMVSNSIGISGIGHTITNGLFKTNIFSFPTITNATIYGSSTVSNMDFTGNLGFDGFASYIDATGDYFTLDPESGLPVYLGLYGGVEGVSADSANFTNSVYAGTIYPTNINAQGPSQFSATNQFRAGSDIGFTRLALSSLANGNNAAVPVGTNVFVEVSGPSSAFSVNGIAGSPNRDGKLLILLNLTAQNMTIEHDSGVDPTAGNRIYTMTGSAVATTGNGSALLIYNASVSRWILLFSSP